MVLLTKENHAASSVAQGNQGRVRGLGRGPRSKSQLQSPYKLKTLKILQCNINGLSTRASRVKLEQTLDIANAHDVQIIAIQETKLNATSNLKINGYSIFRHDRPSGRGGGLAFLIRDINYKSIDCTNFGYEFEIQGMEISWRGSPFYIYNVYHPPNLSRLPGCFSRIFNDNTIIVGDLNAKHPSWGCSSSNGRGEDLLNLIDDTGFMLLNDGTPTHASYSYNTMEALDISLASSNIHQLCNWTVMDTVGSDHLPIQIEIKKKQRIFTTRESYWNFAKADWESYQKSVDNSLLVEPFTEDVNANWLKFKTVILKNAKSYVPRGNIKRFVPHFTHKDPLLEPLIMERKLLLQQSAGSGNSARIELNKLNAEIKLAYAHLRRNSWIKTCNKLDARASDSRLWKIVKGINRELPHSESSNTIINNAGQLSPNDKAAADCLGSYYQSSNKLNFSSNDRPTKRKAKNIVNGCRSTDLGAPQLARKYSSQELLLALSFLDLTKSPGPDGIHGKMLENLGYMGKQKLLDLINVSWVSGRLPVDWKRATIIPIRKPGKDAGSPDSYRPISLTCITCKLMEKMFLARLQHFLIQKNLMPAEQYGFRRGHSTTDQILYFCQKIRDAQNFKPTHHTVASLLDLSKAFDTVWRDKLIVKLHNSFNIRGPALVWIADFLHHRSIRVKFNKTFSDPFSLGQGVPQGSVLSPTLFALYLSGIENNKPSTVNIAIFADDIALWCSGTEVNYLETQLNTTLVAFTEFATEHKLSFNPAKSIVTFFTTNKHLYNYKPHLILCNQPLIYDKHPRYLGFILDPEFNSNRHIDHLVTKARKRINILKYIAGRDWGSDANTLRTTYISLIRPILEYGYPIYSCASETNLQKLERVQLSAARIILGLRNSCPSDIALFETNLEPLHYRRRANLVKYFNKIYSYGPQHRTSLYLHNWNNNRRLKKHSPFSLVASDNLISREVEPQSLSSCIDPSAGLPRVSFHFALNSNVNKQTHHDEYLRQLSLEIISSIPDDAVQIYTDGSRTKDRTGSGIYIKTPHCDTYQIKQRNPDTCSVFRSELIAINVGLDTILSCKYDFGELWILSDSRSGLQHLSNWLTAFDDISISILLKLKKISRNHYVHLQWIPSHVNIPGNEIADRLAKEGSEAGVPSYPILTFQELYSKEKLKLNLQWRIPPVHHWYTGTSPGALLETSGDRGSQTAIARLISGHIRCLTFEGGRKVYPTCLKCSHYPASPEHILGCIGLSRGDLRNNPLLVIDFLMVNRLLELI